MTSLKKYFSWKGSFSQSELLIAHIGVFLLILSIGFLQESLKEYSWSDDLGLLMFPIIGFYALAIGKRLRDIGSSVWYGILGALIPILGLALIFIPGEKSKLKQSTRNYKKDES